MVDLADRIERVRSEMARCTACPWLCGVDRTAGPAGRCGLGLEGRVFHHYLSLTEEPAISPTYEILFSGCSHRCGFCTVLDQVERPLRTARHDAASVAAGLEEARGRGLRTVSVVGGEPTVNLLAILELLQRLRPPEPLVWNSNMFTSDWVHDVLAGVVDTYVGDFHFGNDACAQSLARTSPYVAPIRASFRRAARSARVIVRHLLVPGHEDCCFEPIALAVAEDLPGAELHVMGGYLPPSRGTRAPRRALPARDADRARRRAEDLGLRLVGADA